MIEIAVVKPVREGADRQCNQCGRCCEDVQLAVSPEALEAGMKVEDGEVISDAGVRVRVNEEYRQIANMLEFKFAGRIKITGREEYRMYHYTCKNFKRENGVGICGIYDTRPAMCRIFPVPSAQEPRQYVESRDYTSQYPGCTYNKDDGPIPWIESEIIEGI